MSTTAAAEPTSLRAVRPLRDAYVREMNCQVIYDSLHDRSGWTAEYLLRVGGAPAGHGTVAVGGPWKGKPTVCEFHVVPEHRGRVFDLFAALVAAGGAVAIETQSNAPLLTAMLHTFARDVFSEAVLFEDGVTTTLPPPAGATFRRATRGDRRRLPEGEEKADYLLELGGAVAASGGILDHYNRPYGDLYMAVAEPYRGRGLGAYLVQELKRACREGGSVPAARCNTDNVPSRRTLQKAGFVPCGHILIGSIASAPRT